MEAADESGACRASLTGRRSIGKLSQQSKGSNGGSQNQPPEGTLPKNPDKNYGAEGDETKWHLPLFADELRSRVELLGMRALISYSRGS